MYYVQQQIVATWTTMAVMTQPQDALFQMMPIYGSQPLQLNTLRVVDDLSNVYATKAFLNTVITLLPTPSIVTPILSLYIY